MIFNLDFIKIGRKEIIPLIEGGKGIGVSNGCSAGSWAACGGIGTFSGANPDFYDENGEYFPYVYKGKTRKEKHFELIEQSIKGCIAQAEVARSYSKDGFLNMNVLWEMGGCEQILEGVLSKASGIIDGITCGAGMPYALSKIASKYRVFYFPIISSARAFRVLWKRSYKDHSDFLGGVVYEDPWIAGGHNGLSSAEDPFKRESPHHRLIELRSIMNEFGLNEVPIIMAGGVWNLSEWTEYIGNPEIGKIAFQFGTRPLLTKESPISDAWKKRLLELKENDVLLNKFSPTGFYSSGVYNKFLQDLNSRSKRQIEYREAQSDEFSASFLIGPRRREIFIKKEDLLKAEKWILEGFTECLRTPDKTIVFETTAAAQKIHKDQVECMGCLSACKFSNWTQHEDLEMPKPDPRSFCIQKTLQDIAHGGDIDNNLMFAGANVFRFAKDPFYANGFIPTVKELFERIKQGE